MTDAKLAPETSPSIIPEIENALEPLHRVLVHNDDITNQLQVGSLL
jgi:hypothetical protein